MLVKYCYLVLTAGADTGIVTDSDRPLSLTDIDIVIDLNLPDIDWTTETVEGHQYSNAINTAFLSAFQELGLSQIVDFPTRLHNTLDLFLTNRPSMISKCTAIPGVSDHEMILTISDIQAKRIKPVSRKILLWNKANIDNIRNDLSTFSSNYLTEVTINTPVEEQWKIISRHLTHILDDLVPSKMSTTRFNQPWITRQIKRLAKKKSRSYNKAKQSNDPRHWQRYKSLKKQMQFDCRRAHQKHINDMICGDMANNPNKFWSYIKSKRCDNTGVASLFSDGQLHSDNISKTRLLNDQFSSVFTRTNTSGLPNLGPSPHPDIRRFDVTEEGVLKLLKNINHHKAPGPDNIPGRLLKEGAIELSPIFTLLFNSTLHQGKIPSPWKQAHVAPVHKKNSRHDPANYRPISLTSVTCKIIEHIIYSQVINHLDSNGILTDKQFGFRKRHSCETQLLLTVQDLAQGLRDQQQIDAVILDFSKAFDKVSHRHLLLKLEHYGIRGPTLSWIGDFLANRTQRVMIEGTQSETAPVTSGVPQGSVLGPLLFLCYINDLPTCVSSDIRLFADDCLLYRTIHSQQDAVILQEDLNMLQQWEAKWLMSFNPGKCEVLRVTNKRKHIIHTHYKIHGMILDTVDKTKYLGVTIQSKLNWKPHIHNITKKANSVRAFLQRNLSNCPRPVKEQAYKTYVRPILEYASTVWDPHTKELTSQLEMVQRRAARFVTADYRRRHSVTLMLNQLQWQTLLQRRTHSKVTMLYRIHHQLVAIPATPPYIIYSSTSNRGHHLQLQQHHCRINSYQHSFFPSVVNLWNQLPSDTVGAASLNLFQNRLASLTLR